jgi:hypothetical protein
MPARALESAATLAQLIFNDWQANGRPVPDHLTIIKNYAGSISTLANLGPHPTQSVSIAFRNVTDKLLRIFPRLKITIR